MIDDLLQWDREAFLALNGAGVSWLDQPMLLVSTTWFWIPFYAWIGYQFFIQLKTPAALVAVAFCVVGVILADQGTYWLFKENFKRLRPCQVDELLAQMRFLADYCGKYGFVSSHAANTFGFAILAGGILKQQVKWLSPALLFWALVVSYSRIYIGVHYPLDVICGALFGMFIGKILLRVAEKRIATLSVS
jgi:undecaprenyl-diphosphatase